MISLDKDNIPLENYSKSLSTNQEKFLMSNDFRGMSSKADKKQNPTDIRKNIMHNLQGSMKSIHQIMKYTKNLKENEIYEIFNAVNLKSFFGSLLRDSKLNASKTNQGFKYDLRTCENARLMLEESLNYLVNSPEFNDRKSTMENCKQIREDFKLLSKSQLSKEHLRIIMNQSKEDEEKYNNKLEKIYDEFIDIQNKLDQVIIKCPSITNLPDSIDHDKIGHALKQTREIILLKLTRINIEPKKTTADKKEYTKLVKEVEVIEEGLKLIKTLKTIEEHLIEQENNLYNEIQYYFSPINPIRDKTEYEKNQTEMHYEFENMLKEARQ